MHRIHYRTAWPNQPNLGSVAAVATALERLSDRDKRLRKRGVVKRIILKILIGESLPIKSANQSNTISDE